MCAFSLHGCKITNYNPNRQTISVFSYYYGFNFRKFRKDGPDVSWRSGAENVGKGRRKLKSQCDVLKSH